MVPSRTGKSLEGIIFEIVTQKVQFEWFFILLIKHKFKIWSGHFGWSGSGDQMIFMWPYSVNMFLFLALGCFIH